MAYHHGNLRQALLDRAAEVIAERGVEAVSLRALARDLGVSHSAPGAHFAERGALLCALAEEGFQRSVDAMNDGADAAGADPMARYRAIGRAYVQFALDHPALFRACNHPDVRASADRELRDAQRRFLATLRDGVVAAQQAGWHPEADTDALVAFSTAAAMGTAELLADEGWSRVMAADDVDGLADSVLDLIVHRSRTSALPSPESEREPKKRKAS